MKLTSQESCLHTTPLLPSSPFHKIPPAFFRGKETTSVSGDIRQSHELLKFTLCHCDSKANSSCAALGSGQVEQAFQRKRDNAFGVLGSDEDCLWHVGCYHSWHIGANQKCVPALPSPAGKRSAQVGKYYCGFLTVHITMP